MAEGDGPAVKLHQLVGSLQEEYIPGKDVMIDPAIWGKLPFSILIDVFAFSSIDVQTRLKVLSKDCKRCIETPAFRLQASAAKPLPAAICAYEVIGGHGCPADLHEDADVPDKTVTMFYPQWDRQDSTRQSYPSFSTGKVHNMSLSFLPHDMQGLLTSNFDKQEVSFFGNGLLCLRKYGSGGQIVMVNMVNRTWRLLPELKLPETFKGRELCQDKEADEISCHLDEGSGTFKVVHFFHWSDDSKSRNAWCVAISSSARDSWKVVEGEPYPSPTYNVRSFVDIKKVQDQTSRKFVRAFADNRLYTQFNVLTRPDFDHSIAELIVHSLDDGALLEVIRARWPPTPTTSDLQRAGFLDLINWLPGPDSVKFEEWKGLWYYKGNLYGAVTFVLDKDALLGITMLHPDKTSWGPVKLLPNPPWHDEAFGWAALVYGWDGNLGLAGQYIWVARYYMKMEPHNGSPDYDNTGFERYKDEIWHDWHTVALFDIHADCWLDVFSDIRDKKSCKLSMFEPKAVHIHL